MRSLLGFIQLFSFGYYHLVFASMPFIGSDKFYAAVFMLVVIPIDKFKNPLTRFFRRLGPL
ncbi:MAG: hypothetical protein ACJAZF_003609 [Granulosicoccus sp.]|jgi:hypothetical protein